MMLKHNGVTKKSAVSTTLLTVSVRKNVPAVVEAPGHMQHPLQKLIIIRVAECSETRKK